MTYLFPWDFYAISSSNWQFFFFLCRCRHHHHRGHHSAESGSDRDSSYSREERRRHRLASVKPLHLPSPLAQPSDPLWGRVEIWLATEAFRISSGTWSVSRLCWKDDTAHSFVSFSQEKRRACVKLSAILSGFVNAVFVFVHKNLVLSTELIM